MKFLNKIDRFSPLDITLFIVFIIYIVFPVETPDFMAGLVNSPLGMLTMFIITIFLFLYTNPTLAILYIFVAYELLRRSNSTIKSQYSASYTQEPTMAYYTQEPTMFQPTMNMNTENPAFEQITTKPLEGVEKDGFKGGRAREGFTEGLNFSNKTLEEEVVQQMAPLGGSNLSDTAISSSYQPICDPVKNASMFCAQPNR
jgi:hypothetical protein